MLRRRGPRSSGRLKVRFAEQRLQVLRMASERLRLSAVLAGQVGASTAAELRLGIALPVRGGRGGPRGLSLPVWRLRAVLGVAVLVALAVLQERGALALALGLALGLPLRRSRRQRALVLVGVRVPEWRGLHENQNPLGKGKIKDPVG